MKVVPVGPCGHEPGGEEAATNSRCCQPAFLGPRPDHINISFPAVVMWDPTQNVTCKTRKKTPFHCFELASVGEEDMFSNLLPH